jgi:hypothetical protein
MIKTTKELTQLNIRLGDMQVDMKIKCILFFCLISFGLRSYGHEQIVHQAITVNAAAAALNHSPSYVDFINLITSDGVARIDATNRMVLGSYDEDFSGQDAGGNRSYNHFYDPLDQTYGKGLSDIPPDIRGIVGLDSFTWASTSNCLGYNFVSIIGLGSNIGTSNIWSWQNARGYEWLGLTATNQLERQANLLAMFRAVGQVMHLLEDASQPQHVRNEQHVYPFTNWITTKLDPWISPIEKYGKDHVYQLNYGDGSMLDWRGDGFTKLEDFWDRHLYNGDAGKLSAAENGGDQLGMAEWCNGNFLGDRHTYAEFSINIFGQKTIKYYPNPSLKYTTQPLLNPNNLSGTVIAPSSLENGKIGNKVYISKTGAGVPVMFHSALTYFAVKHPPRLNTPAMGVGLTIRDDNVLSNYHAIFIPKAVKYSAGLIDYYFRGDISGQITDYDTNTMLYTVSIQNTSSTNFGGGTFYFYQRATNGMQTFDWSTNLIQILSGNVLSAGGSITVKVPGPLPTNGQFVCIYQGNIGADASGSALDPVDKNIAIAATTFNDRSIIFDMTYDNTNAEADLYLTDPCDVTHYDPDYYPDITSSCCNVVGGDNEDDSQAHQHMVVSGMQDGNYVLWVNYEGDDTNAVNCTLVTTSASAGVLSTNTFTLNTPATGQFNQYGWPIGVTGPATVDTNGVPTTSNASWYVRKTITISNGKPVSY